MTSSYLIPYPRPRTKNSCCTLLSSVSRDKECFFTLTPLLITLTQKIACWLQWFKLLFWIRGHSTELCSSCGFLRLKSSAFVIDLSPSVIGKPILTYNYIYNYQVRYTKLVSNVLLMKTNQQNHPTKSKSSSPARRTWDNKESGFLISVPTAGQQVKGHGFDL